MEKTAFLFAGQGSQYPGMGKDLYAAFPASRSVFDKADKILGHAVSRDCFEGSVETLKNTMVSQPVIVTVTVAAYEAFRAQYDCHPVVMAGLSLGEYSALIVAGSLSLENGLMLVRRRAQIMDDAARKRPGKMAAVIGLPLAKVRSICESTNAEIANMNAPDQTVISGAPASLEAAAKACEIAGAKRVIVLEVSGAFHSSLMLEASHILKQVLDSTGVTVPRVPVISNFTAKPHGSVDEIKQNLVYQMYSSVRWEESIRYILSQGVRQFVEFGPGKVLKGLMRKIDSSVTVATIENKEDMAAFASSMPRK